METAKKDDAFRQDHEGYVGQHKARGLQQHFAFRRQTQGSAARGRGPRGPNPAVHHQWWSFQRAPRLPTSYGGPKTGKSQLPPWHTKHPSGGRPQWRDHYQPNGAHCLKTPTAFWEDHSRYYWSSTLARAKERSHQEATAEATALEPHSQRPAQGRAQEDQESLGKRKAEGEPLGAVRPKHRKKGHQDAGDGTKARRQEQRMRETRDRSQEWDLWDEAILGACH